MIDKIEKKSPISANQQRQNDLNLAVQEFNKGLQGIGIPFMSLDGDKKVNLAIKAALEHRLYTPKADTTEVDNTVKNSIANFLESGSITQLFSEDPNVLSASDIRKANVSDALNGLAMVLRNNSRAIT